MAPQFLSIISYRPRVWEKRHAKAGFCGCCDTVLNRWHTRIIRGRNRHPEEIDARCTHHTCSQPQQASAAQLKLSIYRCSAHYYCFRRRIKRLMNTRNPFCKLNCVLARTNQTEVITCLKYANCGQLLVARSWQSGLFRDRTSGGKPSSIR